MMMADYEGSYKLSNWIYKWQLKFSAGRCKLIHTGKSNPRFTYKTRGFQLTNSTQKQNFGVIINHSMKAIQLSAR